MLSKPNRLTAREVERVFKEGRIFIKTPFFSFKALASTKTTPAKFAIVVSAKTAKLANDRNLIKRRLRNALREFAPACQPGAMAALVGYESSAKADFRELQAVIKKTLERAKILNSSSARGEAR